MMEQGMMARQSGWVRAWYTVCSRCGRTVVHLVGPWDEPHPVVLGWRYSLCEACEAGGGPPPQHGPQPAKP
jgi:hypothetical protein